MIAALTPNCLDEGLDDFLTSLLTQVLYVSSASLVNLHLYSPEFQRGDRHLSVGDDGLLQEAKELVAYGIQAGEPLIVTRLLPRDRDCLPQVSRLREVGIEAVLVYPVQISPEHPLGRLIVFSRTSLDETLTKTIGAILETLVVVITLAIEAHNRTERERFLELRWRSYKHLLRNNLTHLLGRLSGLKSDYPDDLRLRKYSDEIEAFGILMGLVENEAPLVGGGLKTVVGASLLAVLNSHGCQNIVKSEITGVEVEGLLLKQLEAVAMVLIELVTDSLKYAWEVGERGEIMVDISRRKEPSGELIVVHYSDNGQGLPIDFDPQKTSGTGLKLAERVAKEIGGKFEFGRILIGYGFSATLSFPK